MAAADSERPLDVVVTAEAASAFLSGPGKRLLPPDLLTPNMFILEAVLCLEEIGMEFTL